MSNNSYNYAKHIKSPKDLDVSKDGNIFVSIRDTNAIFPYIDTLIYGKNVISDSSIWDLYPLGSNSFIKSGTCGDTSSDECKGQDRYIYVRNVPNGVIPCMGSFTPKTDSEPVWIVSIDMPRRYVDEFSAQHVEAKEDEYIDQEDTDSSAMVGQEQINQPMGGI